MTTNANLLPGSLIWYQSAHSLEQAWVCERPVPAHTEGMVKIRVKGETGINTDLEFDLYVKARGRAKVIDGPSIDVDKLPLPGDPAPVDDAPTRVVRSHDNCEHPKTKAARAACRKARS